jgi:predicted alpha/beta hydrolase family esterase
MKRQVLFIQGGGKGVHDEWDNELVASLGRELGPGYEIRYPRMPDEDKPDYAAWKTALERELASLQDGAILVGHSIGATILIHALGERRPQQELGAIVLIAAPFVGEGGWPADGLEPLDDVGARLPDDVPIHVVHGLADETAPPSHAALYRRAIPRAVVHLLPDRDHQLNNDLGEVAAAIKDRR